MAALVVNIIWLFVVDYQIAPAAFALLVLLVILLVTCVYFSIRGLRLHGAELYAAGLCLHVRLVRGLIQNGIMLYATWAAIWSVFALAGMLQEHWDAPREAAAEIIFAILLGKWVIFLVLDWYVFEAHMRYIFTPYFVMVAVSAGLFVANFDPWDIPTILATALLAVAGLSTLLKFIIAPIRICNCPDPVLVVRYTKEKVYTVSPNTVAAHGSVTTVDATTPVVHRRALFSPAVSHFRSNTMTYDRPGSLLSSCSSVMYDASGSRVF